MILTPTDTARRTNSPPLQGRGRGWGLSADALAELKRRAREMRNNPTEPEKRLWRNLSNGQLDGHKFRRQEVIGRCIVDFWCPAAGLAVEVDGDTHADPDRDARRDAYLRQFGVSVLHVTNPDVMRNIEGVVYMIGEALKTPPLQGRGRSRAAAEGVGAVNDSSALAQSPHPNPSPEGEGLEGASSLEGTAAIATLVAIAKQHGLTGEFSEWSERDVWWFAAPMPNAVRAAGNADSTLRYWSYDGSPHDPADEGFSDADRLAISFLSAK